MKVLILLVLFLVTFSQVFEIKEKACLSFGQSYLKWDKSSVANMTVLFELGMCTTKGYGAVSFDGNSTLMNENSIIVSKICKFIFKLDG